MSKPYRQCVRVIIFNQDKILLARMYKKGVFIAYDVPGGGVEEGETHLDVIKKECLEEVGVKVKSVRDMGLSLSYDEVYDSKAWRDRWCGGMDHWYTAQFDGMDSSLFNREGDGMGFSWVTIKEAIASIINGPANKYNSMRLEALTKAASMFDYGIKDMSESIKRW